MISYNPSDHIIDNIWLGNYAAAENIRELKDKGIKKILTLMDYRPFYLEQDGFIHKWYNIEDFDSQNILQYFGECLHFMKGEEKILVHCMAGASRSATIVIAYLMWTQKMDYEKAFQFVKDKRFIVFPNYGFRKQLKQFEKLLKENDYDIDKINFKEIKIEK